MGGNLLLILVAVALILLNAFFVAAEFGLVKLRQTRVKAIAKRLGWRGRILAKVHEDLDAYLSACQLGITLASLGLGWIGEPAFAGLIEPPLAALGVESREVVDAVALAAAFGIISYLHIIVGELAPKSLAIRMSERIGIWTAVPLYVFYWLMYPAIWALNHSAIRVLRLLRLDTGHAQEAQYSPEELKLILRSSRADTHYSGDEWRVLAQALDFRDLEVADLMRPFHEVVALVEADSLDRNLDRIARHRYSRYPCIDAAGRVRGVVHVKDVLLALRKGRDIDLAALARPILTVAPTQSATELFRRFRHGRPHFAVVGYPGGRPLGFITLDNLLGALVGEIRDEFRTTHNDWTKLDDGTLIGKGSLPIFTLERALGIDVEAGEADTVGGLIYRRLDGIPVEGQRIPFDGFDAVVKKMHGPRIALLHIVPQREAAAE